MGRLLPVTVMFLLFRNTKAALSYLDQRSDLKPIREEIEKLKKQLAFWSSNEGSDKALRGQVKDLMKKLDDQRLEYDKLHLMIDFFESVSLYDSLEGCDVHSSSFRTKADFWHRLIVWLRYTGS